MCTHVSMHVRMKTDAHTRTPDACPYTRVRTHIHARTAHAMFICTHILKHAYAHTHTARVEYALTHARERTPTHTEFLCARKHSYTDAYTRRHSRHTHRICARINPYTHAYTRTHTRVRTHARHTQCLSASILAHTPQTRTSRCCYLRDQFQPPSVTSATECF